MGYMEQYHKKPEGGLLQSEAWMNVLRSEGKYVVDVHDGRDVLWGVEHRVLPIGKYLYFPRVTRITPEILGRMCLLPYAWIRVDADNDDVVSVLNGSAYDVVRAPHDMQPRCNLIMDITESEDVLLNNMKTKTRYNIRLAQKKGVRIIVSREPKHINAFCRLVTMTGQRKNVLFHNREHYEQIIAHLSDRTLSLYVAQYDNKMVAANLVTFYDGVATYLHGATSNEHRNVMAPFLLQWQAICDARARGCTWYDLGGVFADSKDPGKIGITRFKSGFAPHEIFYDTRGSFDVILTPLRYKMYRLFRHLRS